LNSGWGGGTSFDESCQIRTTQPIRGDGGSGGCGTDRAARDRSSRHGDTHDAGSFSTPTKVARSYHTSILGPARSISILL